MRLKNGNLKCAGITGMKSRMKESYMEGIAIHHDSGSYVYGRGLAVPGGTLCWAEVCSTKWGWYGGIAA